MSGGFHKRHPSIVNMHTLNIGAILGVQSILHTQCDMHMVAARLGYQSAMVGTGSDNSCPGCMDRLRKCYLYLVEGSFLAGKAAWAVSGRLSTKSADYCMLVK